MPAVELRQITVKELDSVLSIQAQCYSPEYLEGKQTFAQMLEAFPSGARFIVLEKKIVGYLFFHPWFSGETKQLNNKNFLLGGKEDCLYLHDLAILPEARGKGVAKVALDYFDAVTKQLGFSKQFLVAVQGSETFWQSNGFSTIQKISYAGKPASFMKKEV